MSKSSEEQAKSPTESAILEFISVVDSADSPKSEEESAKMSLPVSVNLSSPVVRYAPSMDFAYVRNLYQVPSEYTQLA